jgi:hypothetical protein
MTQFFKSYHRRHHYSLSGFFHISTSLTLQEICALLTVDEWLDSYKYYVKACPSQREEMIQIRALCYSSELLYRANLKIAITSNPDWSNERDEDSHPIFDLYLSDFSASGKKTKMIFVSAEHSRQDDVSSRFKRIYDGMQKSYPNGSMMLFIPSLELQASSAFRSKIGFNHLQYIGEETIFSIGGLNDLNNKILLCNGKATTIVIS